MPPGLVLGVDADSVYETRTGRLLPGDTLLAYSDGVTEAMDERRRQFGSAGMLEALRSCGAAAGPEQVTERVMERVRAHAGRAPQSDDITLMAVGLRREGPPPARR